MVFLVIDVKGCNSNKQPLRFFLFLELNNRNEFLDRTEKFVTAFCVCVCCFVLIICLSVCWFYIWYTFSTATINILLTGCMIWTLITIKRGRESLDNSYHILFYRKKRLVVCHTGVELHIIKKTISDIRARGWSTCLTLHLSSTHCLYNTLLSPPNTHAQREIRRKRRDLERDDNGSAIEFDDDDGDVGGGIFSTACFLGIQSSSSSIVCCHKP